MIELFVFPTLLPCDKWRNKECSLNVGDVIMIKLFRLKVDDHKQGQVKVYHDERSLERLVATACSVSDLVRFMTVD